MAKIFCDIFIVPVTILLIIKSTSSADVKQEDTCLLNTGTGTSCNATEYGPSLLQHMKNFTASPTNRKPGLISKQRCREYAKYTSHGCSGFSLRLRIAGGSPAEKHEYPHMAQIGYKNEQETKWVCGGSLISENFVLTAEHCMLSKLSHAALVRLGITNQLDNQHLLVRKVEKMIFPPKYPSKYHDIGLLKLVEKVKLHPKVRPACLYTEDTIAYKVVTATGWGKIEYAGEPSNDLLKVDLHLFSAEKCDKKYIKSRSSFGITEGIVDKLLICAGSSMYVRDTCEGDSGGPLQALRHFSEEFEFPCVYDIVGVTSFGLPCGLGKSRPGVYARVSAHIKWIEDTVWPEGREIAFDSHLMDFE